MVLIGISLLWMVTYLHYCCCCGYLVTKLCPTLSMEFPRQEYWSKLPFPSLGGAGLPNHGIKPMSIESVMPSNHFILCHPILLLPSIFPSIRVFSNDSVLCIRWPKYWSFKFSISASNEYSGLISFRIDWLDLLAVQGTVKSLLQLHSSKASQFFTTQLSL